MHLNNTMAMPSISTIFIQSLLLFILLSITLTLSDNKTDFEALLAFKKSIDADPLGALRSWNETSHFCTWNGVSCRKNEDRVVSLSLHSQGLVGTLSPYIGNLSFLRIIDLENNTFRGSIPQEIGRLKRLQVIEFNNNSFSGGIPINISQCTNLYYLNLIDNDLTGDVVSRIDSLVNLQQLGLSKNMLLGTIPPSLGNLTNLIQLSLASCGLQGEIPDSLAQFKKIRILRLFDNNLTGSIPLGLFNLSNVELLSLSTNRLHGTIPSNIVLTLPKLRVLSIGINHFTGALPSSLSNSSIIESIQVYANNFTGNMIDLTMVSTLEKLLVSSNQLEGDIHTILSSLTNSTHLDVLGLDDNLFNGYLPDSIGNLSIDLSLLTIGENLLSGSIPSSFGKLVGLTSLSLQIANLQGSIPSSIGKLHKLQLVDLGENKLTNEMPMSFGNMTLLNSLYLERNNLLGNIPQSLGNCSNLLMLDLSYNNFSGSIPPEIMRLSSITIGLDLSFNILMGTIPEVGSLRNINYLALSHNRLSGVIPSSLSSCILLDFLDLGSNSIQGEIPESLGALRGLQHLDLSFNNFSGKIPKFLIELSLIYLNLSFNALQGEVPTLGVFQNESAISLQGNHDLCGGIAILNFPSCSSTNSKRKDLVKILIPIAGAIGLALSMCFCVIVYRIRTSQKVGNPASTFVGPEFLRLTYADLLKSTSGFLESSLLGVGRFGSVYKGIMNGDDNEETSVAVKVLNLNVRGAYKTLVSECNALRDIRHRNLLKIMSVCDGSDFQGNDFKALVYEYMSNGSLESWLHHNNEEQGRILSFTQRLDIAIDIASAVEYLHCGTDSIVIHGDLKPSNILLDQDMVAHVGDFGLAKIISENQPLEKGSSSIAIKGTIGYIPPEYGMNNIVSTQGDAYSYGIVVLEMFTNIRPTSDALKGYVNLQDFVSGALPDHLIEVVDPFLHQHLNESDKNMDCIVSILSIGRRCSKELISDRMSMTEVVNDLKRIRSTIFVGNVRA